MIIPPPVQVLSLPVHPITTSQLIETLVGWAEDRTQRRIVFYANSHALNLAWELPEFEAAYEVADLVFCDGFGAKWAAAIGGDSLPARMTPPDWIDDFFARLPRNSSVYLVGDQEAVVGACARAIAERHPSLTIAGAHAGFFELKSAEESALLRSIEQSSPNVLLVGMGMPRQELWIAEHRDRLNVPVAMTVGGLLRYYSGASRRPPAWMTGHGLEWLGRLFLEPASTYRRYLGGNVKFLSRLIRHHAHR